ncbi:hypothetical protein P253_02677 [Acinetobacter indicus CIP 110367]|uniref:Uncharacterized protein n=1 Tax=Acinetobacter indicus CIP 110367 TaxID=1341679 RepID=V2TY39_9GAMM|nr:hypothetical protein F956_01172 [Acinetobacter indicus ANC 4215]ESK46958.1 hypothetical protein P253_02677 [Acinetobacter indicus CIP 110367]
MSNDLNEHFDLPMISIKRTIEKLFGDEQFERAQHINFVIELLSSQQTDNYLDGLNLDCFDIDVEFQSNLPKPSVISFSKKVKISDLPITSYVNSISQLSESQTHAKNWNILVLKAASVHDKFHRTLILSGFCFLKIAKISLNSSFFPKPIKR